MLLVFIADAPPLVSSDCSCTVPLTPVGKTDNRCYLRGDVGAHWRVSEKICTRQGGHLALVVVNATNDLLTDKHNASSGVYWIGGSYDGAWKWTDGSPFEFASWYKGMTACC